MSLFAGPRADAVPIHCVTRDGWAGAAERLGEGAAFARALGFEGGPGRQALLAGPCRSASSPPRHACCSTS